MAKILYLSWLTRKDQGSNCSVVITDEEFEAFKQAKGFPHEIDLDGEDDPCSAGWPEIPDRAHLFGTGIHKDDGSRADCTRVIY